MDKLVSIPVSQRRTLSKVDNLGAFPNFPNNTKPTQKILFNEDAIRIINKAKAEGRNFILAAAITNSRYYDTSIYVGSNFSNGVALMIVDGGEHGRKAGPTTSSIKEAIELVKKGGIRLSDASVLLDTEFLDRYTEKIILFSSKNVSHLCKEELKSNTGYLVGPAKETQTPKAGAKTTQIDAELKTVLDREVEIMAELKQLANMKRELIELRSKAEQADRADERTAALLRLASHDKETIADSST